MRRPSLTLRFFLTLAALALAIVVLMTIAIRWSVRHDIVDYFQRREFARLQPLQDALVAAYAEYGDWRFLQNRPDTLKQLIQVSGLTDRRPDRGPSSQEARMHEPRKHRPGPVSEIWPEAGRRPPPDRLPPELPPLHARLQVLDARMQLVVGEELPPESGARQQPLRRDGTIIGYLQLQLPPFVNDGLEQRFLSGQLRTLLIIASGALLLALLVAWWLGRNLVKPILSVAGTVRQLADGKLASRTIVGRHDELGQLARDVDRLAETLTANERLRRDVMADLSHEFRTPLALLQAKIEAMQDGILPCDEIALATLHDATMRLSRMVDDLYQVALADTGALRLHCQQFNLRELVDQAIAESQTKIEAADLRVTASGEPDLPCYADRQRLRQVLDNLLHNSVRYTDAGGEIWVHVRRDGVSAQVTVEDSAPGVPTEQHEKVFDRFFRVESSRSRDAGGSGLGLSVVKAIVQAHGGSVTAYRSRLGGLAIVMRLPLKSGEVGGL